MSLNVKVEPDSSASSLDDEIWNMAEMAQENHNQQAATRRRGRRGTPQASLFAFMRQLGRMREQHHDELRDTAEQRRKMDEERQQLELRRQAVARREEAVRLREEAVRLREEAVVRRGEALAEQRRLLLQLQTPQLQPQQPPTQPSPQPSPQQQQPRDAAPEVVIFHLSDLVSTCNSSSSGN